MRDSQRPRKRRMVLDSIDRGDRGRIWLAIFWIPVGVCVTALGWRLVISNFRGQKNKIAPMHRYPCVLLVPECTNNEQPICSFPGLHVMLMLSWFPWWHNVLWRNSGDFSNASFARTVWKSSHRYKFSCQLPLVNWNYEIQGTTFVNFCKLQNLRVSSESLSQKFVLAGGR